MLSGERNDLTVTHRFRIGNGMKLFCYRKQRSVVASTLIIILRAGDYTEGYGWEPGGVHHFIDTISHKIVGAVL